MDEEEYNDIVDDITEEIETKYGHIQNIAIPRPTSAEDQVGCCCRTQHMFLRDMHVGEQVRLMSASLRQLQKHTKASFGHVTPNCCIRCGCFMGCGTLTIASDKVVAVRGMCASVRLWDLFQAPAYLYILVEQCKVCYPKVA